MNEQANLSDVDEAAEKARAANIRFKQQVFGTVGSAMLFGLIGVVTTKLLTLGGAASGGLLLPALGMGAVAVVGLSCVYLAAKFISTSVALDQDAQARKIALAKSKAKAVEMEQPAPEAGVSKPMGTPFGVTHAADGSEKSPEAATSAPAPQIPTKTVSNIAAHEKMDKSTELLTSHAAPEASWASRTAANDAVPTHEAGRA